MIEEPIHVTDASFEKSVLQSSLPVVVDFWAPWCAPCRMVAPTLEKLAKENAGKLLVAKVDTDENPEWAGKFGVQGIPTMLFVSGGKVVHRQVGALPEKMLRDVVTQFMDVAAPDPELRALPLQGTGESSMRRTFLRWRGAAGAARNAAVRRPCPPSIPPGPGVGDGRRQHDDRHDPGRHTDRDGDPGAKPNAASQPNGAAAAHQRSSHDRTHQERRR